MQNNLKAWTQCPNFVKRLFRSWKVANLVRSVKEISVPVLMVFLTAQTRGMYIISIISFPKKMFIIMLESGLNYALLSLRMFRKLKVKLRLTDWHFKTFLGWEGCPNI